MPPLPNGILGRSAKKSGATDLRRGQVWNAPKPKRLEDPHRFGQLPEHKPKHSMYAIYAYIGMVWGVNVGIYSIHGVYG